MNLTSIRSSSTKTMVGLLIVLALLPNVIWLAYRGSSPTIWISGGLIPLLGVAILFIVLGRKIWVGCLLLIPAVALSPLESYYIWLYRDPSSAQILGILADTNLQEIHEYVRGWTMPLAILAVVGVTTFGILATVLAKKRRLVWRGKWKERCNAALVAVPLIVFVAGFSFSSGGFQQRWRTGAWPFQSAWYAIPKSYPFGLHFRVASWYRENAEVQKQFSRSQGFVFHARLQPAAAKEKQRQIYVLVIGESSGKDHWSLFGYPRDTTPHLDKLQNIVPLTNMVTPWTVTLDSVPVILTQKSAWPPQPTQGKPSFLVAAEEAGFQTWWMSNQYPVGIFDDGVAAYAREAQHEIWTNPTPLWDNPGAYDGALLAPLRRTVQRAKGNLFIVLHLMGSHVSYDDRYPPKDSYFRPTDRGNSHSTPRWILTQNSYDNSVRYTDKTLSRIIDVLKESRAVTALYYVSDHGEVVPTPSCSLDGHGYGTWHEHEIPAFFWYSPSYKEAYPHKVATLESHVHVKTSTRDTFDSLLDMAGITTPYARPSRDLFSPQWTYKQREVYQYLRADFDHADFGNGCGLVLPRSRDEHAEIPPNTLGHPVKLLPKGLLLHSERLH